MDRFVESLRAGHSLYGIDAGCDEWRAEPGDPDLDLESDASSADDKTPWSFSGQLTEHRDHDGRIYGFSYYVDLDQTPVRMRISGRGRWSPAPGVEMRSPDDPERVVIGVGSYCVSDVELRSDPQQQDAVRVGDETWYLTRDACLQSRDAGSGHARGCSAH